MKIRRSIATAVALAVTAPVTLLAASPAFAETGTTAAATASQTTDAASSADLEKLEKAVADAQAAYDAAVAAEAEAQKAVEAAVSDTAPLAVAYTEAKAAADQAAANKTAADQAVTDAKTALDNMPDDLSDDERVALSKALGDAERAAEAAADAKTAADTAAAAAVKARDDERVAALQKLHTAQEAVKAAKADLDAAKKALEDAKKDTGTPKPDPKPEPKPEPEPGDDEDKDKDDDGDDSDVCDARSKVKVAVSGLPGKVAAGSSVNFTLKVTNHSDRTLDYVQPYAAAFAVDTKGERDLSHLLKLQWRDGSGWKSLSDDDMAREITNMKAGSTEDVKLRLSVDAKAPAGLGFAFAAGSYVNEDGTCGWTPEASRYDFDIVAAGTKTGNEPAKQGKPMPMPQGGTTTPVKAADTAKTTGELARTGSSDVMPQIALAGAAAVALGAGAVFVVRRRKAGADA